MISSNVGLFEFVLLYLPPRGSPYYLSPSLVEKKIEFYCFSHNVHFQYALKNLPTRMANLKRLQFFFRSLGCYDVDPLK